METDVDFDVHGFRRRARQGHLAEHIFEKYFRITEILIALDFAFWHDDATELHFVRIACSGNFVFVEVIAWRHLKRDFHGIAIECFGVWPESLIDG